MHVQQRQQKVRPITLRQREILAVVAGAIRDRGASPTLREIGAALSIASTSVVEYHLARLEVAGMIAREGDRQARSILMTSAGYRELGQPDPTLDAALGRALREAARLDPHAAFVLARLEVA